MHAFGRKLVSLAAVVLLIGATYFATSFEDRPAADFTFINGTEIKSVDPAIVTGQPEGRIIRALFEGLVNWAPDDLRVTPGVAESWTESADGRTLTFQLRNDAKWSNGSPVTAHDFVYSYRRFLDPLTGGSYCYQLYYVVGAEKYNLSDFDIGDAVEVELLDPPAGAHAHARGKLLHGTLQSQQTVVIGDEPDVDGSKQLDDDERNRRTVRLYDVEIDGQTRRFKVGREEYRDAEHSDHEPAAQVLFDFDQVGVKAIDDHTLQITLNNRVPYFVSLTGFYPLYPVHRETVERFGSPAWTKPENIVGNGAFTLHSRKIRDRIRLVRNHQYWDAENVKLNSIDALAVESATTGLNMYENRQVDWVSAVPTVIIPELLKQDRDDLQRAEYLTTAFYRFNVNRPPLGDPRVRRALSLAIDRKQIVDKIIRGGQQPAYSYVPPGIPGYESPQIDSYNPEEARRLLAEAGFPGGDGFPKLTLLFNTSEDLKKIAEAIQFQWQDVLGVRIGLSNQEWNAFLERVHAEDYDIARAGWIGDYVDPNTFLDMFVTRGGNNETGWSSERYDELIKELVPVERDPKRRLELLHDAEQILLDEMPIVPLYFGMRTLLVRPYVKGFHTNIQDVHPLKDISIDEAARARFLEGVTLEDAAPDAEGAKSP